MDYEQFKAQYAQLMKAFFSYTPDQAGSITYAEKLGELVDSVPPEFVDRADLELGYSVS